MERKSRHLVRDVMRPGTRQAPPVRRTGSGRQSGSVVAGALVARISNLEALQQLFDQACLPR